MKIRISKLTVIVLGAIFVLAIEVMWLVSKVNKVPEPENTAVGEVAASSTVYYSMLDGTAVSSTEKTKPLVLGIMIDNHPYARPQSGINSARVVYEAPVEGGITRFMAIYDSSDTVPKVGPVRSARPYYLDWISEYGDSPYWHCGGSPEALSLLKQLPINDVDQFFNDSYFWRSKSKEAPHNLYTDSEKWTKYFSESTAKNTWQGWIFNNELSGVSSTPLTGINIKYDSAYIVSWKYEENTKQYLRLINNKRQIDDAYNSIYGDTIIIQEADIQILDEEGRREIGSIGEGKARVLRDGALIRATWKKANRTDRTRYYDEMGKEVHLKPGKIWVQIVPNNIDIELLG